MTTFTVDSIPSLDGVTTALLTIVDTNSVVATKNLTYVGASAPALVGFSPPASTMCGGVKAHAIVKMSSWDPSFAGVCGSELATCNVDATLGDEKATVTAVSMEGSNPNAVLHMYFTTPKSLIEGTVDGTITVKASGAQTKTFPISLMYMKPQAPVIKKIKDPKGATTGGTFYVELENFPAVSSAEVTIGVSLLQPTDIRTDGSSNPSMSISTVSVPCYLTCQNRSYP